MPDTKNKEYPKAGTGSKLSRSALQIAGGIPVFGGAFSAIAGAWSEQEQERVNKFFQQWLQMLQDELKEKERTIIEIVERLNVNDETVAKRMASPEYQSLLRKTFREWAAAESEQKRIYVRNILANAGAASVASDDVVRLFIDWLKKYSELHFRVIGAIYNAGGISRGEVWEKIGKGGVSEDSADADLYKLLFRDLSTGGIIRQHRDKTWDGRFVKSKPKKSSGASSREMVSAFDREEQYELTALGEQFVHYAMNDIAPKLEYHPANDDSEAEKSE